MLLGLVKIGHCAPRVGAYLWFLFSVLHLSAAPVARHPPALVFPGCAYGYHWKPYSQLLLLSTNPSNPVLTAHGGGEGCCPRCPGMGRGRLAPPPLCSYSAGLIGGCRRGLCPLAFGMGCSLAGTRVLTVGSVEAVLAGAGRAGRGFCCVLLGEVSCRRRVPLLPSPVRV